ncbi:MAG: hypothetical protein COC00_010670 [Rhizobiales bacterium]|nr:hypothetical protein [Hyphomicrobiales bacterium]
MFNLAYAEAAEGDQGEARSEEYQAMEYSIGVMESSLRDPENAGKRIKAIFDTANVWTLLMEDLGQVDNAYPNELKAGLISIGIFILKQLQAMRGDSSVSFATIIDVTKTIKEGLK